MGRQIVKKTNPPKRHAEGGLGKSARISRDPYHGKTIKARGDRDGRRIMARYRELRDRVAVRLETVAL